MSRRIRRQIERTAAHGLADLLRELGGCSTPGSSSAAAARVEQDMVFPLRLDSPYGELALLYTSTIFGSPRDVTLDEIAIETFYPADPATAHILRSRAAKRP